MNRRGARTARAGKPGVQAGTLTRRCSSSSRRNVGTHRFLVGRQRLRDRSHRDQRLAAGGEMDEQRRKQIGTANVDEVGNVARDQCCKIVIEPRFPAASERVIAAGNPPVAMRCACAALPTSRDCTYGAPAPSQISSSHRGTALRAISACVNGRSGTRSTRPASESPMRGASSRLADPLTRKRPAVGSSSTAIFSVEHQLGHTLKLVDERPLAERRREALRIVDRATASVRVVERHDPHSPLRGELRTERRLARLPWTFDSHDARVRERLDDTCRRMPVDLLRGQSTTIVADNPEYDYGQSGIRLEAIRNCPRKGSIAAQLQRRRNRHAPCSTRMIQWTLRRI